MHQKLVQVLGMHLNGINLITVQFLMQNTEMIFGNKTPVP